MLDHHPYIMSEMGQGFVGSNPVAEIDYSLSLRKFQAIVLGIDRVCLQGPSWQTVFFFQFQL